MDEKASIVHSFYLSRDNSEREDSVWHIRAHFCSFFRQEETGECELLQT